MILHRMKKAREIALLQFVRKMKSMTTMQSSMAWDEIKYYEFITAVKDYPKYVPDKLRELDETRLQTIPKTIQQRKSGGQPYMEKSELLTLVEWKL